jgi:hypothetical protein
MPNETIHLEWYRDKGEGQRAADTFDAEQYDFGIWPMARIGCRTQHEADMKWQGLWNIYKVNANTVTRIDI